MSALLLSLSTFFSTLIGGLFGLRSRDHLNLIMGFPAGMLVGLVSFDLLPEVFRLVYALHLDSTGPMLALMGGFLLFHIVEKSIFIHFSHEERRAYAVTRTHPNARAAPGTEGERGRDTALTRPHQCAACEDQPDLSADYWRERLHTDQ